MARRVELVTWDDTIRHLIDWMGANPTEEATRDAKRATMHALREVSNHHNWTYYYSRGRLVTVAPYTTGTIEYDHTGGTYERMVTLTDGTWPSWSAQGTILISDVQYEVYERKSDTVLTLSSNSNPGADVAAETTYTLFRDTFALPAGFQAMGEIVIVGNSRELQNEHPNSWLSRQRVFHGVAMPWSYTILGDANYQNTLAMGLYPPPDNVYTIDYIYKRQPRTLRYHNETAGKISVTSGGLAVTGVGTAFESKMAGSIIRIGSATQSPSARWGSNPFEEERVIVSVQSATSLTVDAAWEDSYGNVKYNISDPMDIDSQAMLTALLRCAELNTAHARTRQDREQMDMNYQKELLRAREADSRVFAMDRVGGYRTYPQRLADMPLDWTE